MGFIRTVFSVGLKGIGILFKGIFWGLVVAGLVSYGISFIGEPSTIRTIISVVAFVLSGALVTFIYLIAGVVKLVNKAAEPLFGSCSKFIEGKVGSEFSNAEPEEMFNMTKGYLCEKSSVVNRMIGGVKFDTVKKSTGLMLFVSPASDVADELEDMETDKNVSKIQNYVSSLRLLWELPARDLKIKVWVVLILVVVGAVAARIYL